MLVIMVIFRYNCAWISHIAVDLFDNCHTGALNININFPNKVALITGAGSGMGREVALLFAKEGARLVLNDLVPETVEETAQLVTEAGGEAIAVAGNVAYEADVEKTEKAGVAQFGMVLMPDSCKSPRKNPA